MVELELGCEECRFDPHLHFLVVDRDSERTEFQEYQIEINAEKVAQSYAEAEKFWEEEEADD
jgi:hypothetical protein